VKYTSVKHWQLKQMRRTPALRVLIFFSAGTAQADSGLHTVDISSLVSSLLALHVHALRLLRVVLVVSSPSGALCAKEPRKVHFCWVQLHGACARAWTWSARRTAEAGGDEGRL